MPDQWGRPTFEDGARIAQGLMTIQAHQTDREAYEAAQAIGSGGDISGFSDEAKYKGAELHWGGRLKKLQTETQEHLSSEAGRRDKMSELDLNLKVAEQRLKQYTAYRQMGHDDQAKEVAMLINNENMFNGRYVEKGEKGGYAVTNWDGKKEAFDDLPIDQVDQILGTYFNKPPEEIMKWQLTAVQHRQQHNYNKFKSAEKWHNPKTGQILFKVPPGTWGPDGKPRGEFFTDAFGEREIPKEQLKGFSPLSVSATRKAINKKDVINPSNLVQGQGPGGKPTQGLIVQGASGQPEFQSVNATGLSTPKDASKAKSAYELQIKQLKTQLMPFNKSGATMFKQNPDGSMSIDLTDSGTTALKDAMDLDKRATANPGALSPEEQKLAAYAQQAVAMYESLSQQNAQAFGLKTGQQGQGAQIQLPNTITKVSQAVEYLIKNHGMNEDQAKQWIRSQYRAPAR